MNKQEIIDYVMKTPNNTNPAVLRHMLDEISDIEELTVHMTRQNIQVDSAYTFQYWVLDKTWQEIHDALPYASIESTGIDDLTGEKVFNPFKTTMIAVRKDTTYNTYYVQFMGVYDGSSIISLSIDDPDGYPRTM